MVNRSRGTHTIYTLCCSGFTVNVEGDAGMEAKFTNAAYEEAGAKMVDSNQAFDSNIVLKVRAPSSNEVKTFIFALK